MTLGIFITVLVSGLILGIYISLVTGTGLKVRVDDTIHYIKLEY